MHKLQNFKIILNTLDFLEKSSFYEGALINKLINELDGHHLDASYICDNWTLLKELRMLKQVRQSFDLAPVATLVAKANNRSKFESLAFFEMLLHNEHIFIYLNTCLIDNLPINLDMFNSFKQKELLVDYLLDTNLLVKANDNYYLNVSYEQDMFFIVGEYITNKRIFLSNTCKLYYLIQYNYELYAQHQKFKNKRKQLISYKNRDLIQTLLPFKGIPKKRDTTKYLQIFFKDTLMYEFSHSCAICGCDVEDNLIASHIRPFRDCAHLIEPLDQNNGLLLCRNHDYLFDQGFISFEQDGSLLISDYIKKFELFDSFLLNNPNFSLDPYYLSHDRKLFLKYHYDNIYLKEQSPKK